MPRSSQTFTIIFLAKLLEHATFCASFSLLNALWRFNRKDLSKLSSCSIKFGGAMNYQTAKIESLGPLTRLSNGISELAIKVRSIISHNLKRGLSSVWEHNSFSAIRENY